MSKAYLDARKLWGHFIYDVPDKIRSIEYSSEEPTDSARNVAQAGQKFLFADSIDGRIIIYTTADEIIVSDDISCMFSGCNNLTDISALVKWNTSHATNMMNLFNGCEKLTDISSLQNWDVSNVENMDAAFTECRSLRNIPLEKWNTSKVEGMSQMFWGCENITDIMPISNWDVSHVTTFERMFTRCNRLLSVQSLRKWEISKDAKRDYMFTHCQSLYDSITIDIINKFKIDIRLLGK